MAEGRYRTFAPLQKLPADWPNAVADFLAPLSNLNLAAKNSTTVMAPVDTQPQLSLGVDGLWRFTEVEIDAAVPAGAAQTFDVVATATANVFKAPSKEGEGESDETSYAFALQVVTHGTLPAGGGIAAAQKVGEVDWDGAKITGLRQLVGQLRSTDPISPAMPIRSVPAIQAKGIAAATAPLVLWSAPEGPARVLEVLNGTKSNLVVRASGTIEWPEGGVHIVGEGGTLALHGKLSVTEAATLSGGGTSTTPAVGDNSTKIATTAFVSTVATSINAEVALKAPLASPALTGNPTAPTQAEADNTTKLATTAYVDRAAGVEKTRAEAAEILKAPLASPALTGAPTAPTPAFGDNSTKIATTSFVTANLAQLAREHFFVAEPEEPNQLRGSFEGFLPAKKTGFVMLTIASAAGKVVKVVMGATTISEYTSTGAPVVVTLPIREGRLWKVENATAVHSSYFAF